MIRAFSFSHITGLSIHVVTSLILILQIFSGSKLMAADLLTSAEHTFYTGADRRVGIEIEFTGLDPLKVAQIIAEMTGGSFTQVEQVVKTNVKDVHVNGSVIYNTAQIIEYKVTAGELGTIIVKPDFNQVDDFRAGDKKDHVVEIVTEPLEREDQVVFLQKIMDRLQSVGAKGASAKNAVAIQMNTEIANGKIEDVDWNQILDLIRVFYHPDHLKQMHDRLQIKPIRLQYLLPLTDRLLEKLRNPGYKASARSLYDDIIYRQSLEILGDSEAWTMPIGKARKKLLGYTHPIVPQVVKQTLLRMSSLLMWALPEDPMSKMYFESGWAVGRPLVEWRAWNSDFQVLSAYKQALGLMSATDEFGYFDHDHLLAAMSGLTLKTIRKMRKDSDLATQKAPLIFRYFLGNIKKVNHAEYTDMKIPYGDSLVTFLPMFEVGKKPVVIPGESVVFHRLPAHAQTIYGKYNPVLVNPYLIQALENKYTEFKFWNEYAPNSMPETVILREIAKPEDRIEVVVARLNQMYPHGWVLKGSWDLGSEKSIITSNMDIVQLVNEYLASDFDLYYQRIHSQMIQTNVAPEYELNMLKQHPNYIGWKLHRLFHNFDLSIVQEKVEILREFRVEVVAGHVLGNGSTLDRYFYEYKYDSSGTKLSGYKAPPKAMVQAVEKYAQDLVNRLPAEFRGMTFGMDIAVLKDGRTIMIESNPGGNSNFLFEEENESVLALGQFLKKYPRLLKEGKIFLGLEPRAQMAYIDQKFKEWGIDQETGYPGFEFLEDKIVDHEFIVRDASQYNHSTVKKKKASNKTCRDLLSGDKAS